MKKVRGSDRFCSGICIGNKVDLKISTENIMAENVTRLKTDMTVFALDSYTELRENYFFSIYHGCDKSCPIFNKQNLKIHRDYNYIT